VSAPPTKWSIFGGQTSLCNTYAVAILTGR